MPHITAAATCEKDCRCALIPANAPKMIVITGGPGAGKTAVLEIIRKQLCRHVAILPEAASIVFGGGFWRLDSASARMCSQRAILHVQQQMEELALGEKTWPVILCDRGLLDGLAYWPGTEDEFFNEARTTHAAAHERYHAVIHLKVPSEAHGYDHSNPLRVESPAQAAQIDRRIAALWSTHPHYHSVDSTEDFLTKAQKALALIMRELPEGCGNSK